MTKRQPEPEVVVVEDSSEDEEEDNSDDVVPQPPPINILENKLSDSMDNSEVQTQESSMEDVNMDSATDESYVSCLMLSIVETFHFLIGLRFLIFR